MDGDLHLAIPVNISMKQTSPSSKLQSDDKFSYSIMNDNPFDCALGFDYIEHIILPESTLQGICIQYKVSALKLRQVNHFSGSTLLLAPKRLIIPLKRRSSSKYLHNGTSNLYAGIKMQDQTTDEYKVHKIMVDFPTLEEAKVRTYLNLHNWNLMECIADARNNSIGERTKIHSEAEECKSVETTSSSYERKSAETISSSSSSLSLYWDFFQNETEPPHRVIREKYSSEILEEFNVKLKVIKKSKCIPFPEVPKNFNNIDTVNYIVEETPLYSTTVEMIKYLLRKRVWQEEAYKDQSRPLHKIDQSIDFGIELQDLSS